MSVNELEKRLAALEIAVQELQRRIPANGPIPPDPATQYHWWRDSAGAFRNDPDFPEVMRLGREYRDSLNAYKRKRKKRRKSGLA